MSQQLGRQGRGVPGFPNWVPAGARRYLEHIEAGVSIRSLARRAACHPSTVLRQVRRFETLRDDFLIDEALRRLGQAMRRPRGLGKTKEPAEMSFQDRGENRSTGDAPADDQALEREARRVLRRLTEPGAVLAVAAEMDKAVVVRDGAGGETMRTAVVAREVAQALALKDWIACAQPGRIARYRITPAWASSGAGPDAGEAETRRSAPIRRRLPSRRAVCRRRGRRRGGVGHGRRGGSGTRFQFGETPLGALARRRDRDGQPFLSDDLVAAGERLREDSRLAQIRAAHRLQDRFLTGGTDEGFGPGDAMGGSRAAPRPGGGALRDLGLGLGDVVLRCCCYLEGLESTEKRMGWSARSGKIVLRIALQRLKRHYEGWAARRRMIG
ncbi:MAG: DUF6456 domain-containing protein [Paracoccaceae bacterium]